MLFVWSNVNCSFLFDFFGTFVFLVQLGPKSLPMETPLGHIGLNCNYNKIGIMQCLIFPLAMLTFTFLVPNYMTCFLHQIKNFWKYSHTRKKNFVTYPRFQISAHLMLPWHRLYTSSCKNVKIGLKSEDEMAKVLMKIHLYW